MKTNVDFVLGFVYGLIAYHAVGFLGAIAIAAAGYVLGNLIIKIHEKGDKNK